MSNTTKTNAEAKREEVAKTHPVVDKTAEKLHDTIDRTASAAAVAEEKVRESITETSEKLDETKVKVKDHSAEIQQTVTNYVKQNPLACLGIAFAAGIVSSKLLR